MQIESLLEKFGSLENKLIDLDLQLESRNNELMEMARVGAMITSILDLDGILSAMMEMSLRLLHAEVGCILTWEEDTEPLTKISWGLDYSLIKMLKLEGEMDIVQWTKGSGETVIINDFPPETEIPAEINSLISAPLNCHGKTIGVLIAVNKTEEDGFNADDKAMLEMLVSFATVAIENSKLLEERLDRQKLEDELVLAKEVQNALLPADDFDFEGACLSNIYYPAGQVGGDYYDIILISPKEFVLVVGDVSNKGVPAALMMTAVRSVVRNEVRSKRNVAEIMNNINMTLCQDVMRREGMFITLFFAHINLETKEMVCSNAGHLPPLLFNPGREEIIQLRQGGIILGQFEECEYAAEKVRLREGDRILCFTDGITESENSRGDMYGREGLLEFAARHKNLDQDRFLKLLKTEIDEYVAGTGKTQFDDITCVLVGIK